MKKEIRKIKALVAVVKDSKGATENERNTSQLLIVKQCKKLINQSGIDAHNVENMIISGYMRILFENNKIGFNIKRDSEEMNKLIQVLKFHDIKFSLINGNNNWYRKICILSLFRLAMV